MYSIGKYESHLSQFSVSPVEFDAGQFMAGAGADAGASVPD